MIGRVAGDPYLCSAEGSVTDARLRADVEPVVQPFRAPFLGARVAARRSRLASTLATATLWLGLAPAVGATAEQAPAMADAAATDALAAERYADVPEQTPAPEPQDRLPPEVRAVLPELSLQRSQVSAYVRRVDDPGPLLAVNAETPRIPASTIKLVTSVAALELLGPDYQWRTQVLITGEVIAGTLEGDLYVKGYGDPFLTTEAYAGLIRAVREKGLRHIAGNLVFDNSHLVPPTAGRGDFDGAAQKSYNALPAALSLNRQLTYVHLYNDRERGGVGLYTEPPLSHLEIVNRAKVVQAPCRGRYHRLSVVITEPELSPAQETPTTTDGAQGVGPKGTEPGAGDIRPSEPLPADAPLTPSLPTPATPAPQGSAIARLTIGGSFASECPDERIPRLILSPAQHAAAAFDALWHQLGGSIDGRVLAARTPRQAKVFHIAYSRPLHELLRTVNKRSDNLMARMLFLALGVEHAGPPGSREKSREALSLWLAERGIGVPELIIDNGSGLSRDTRIAAASLGELLAWAYHQPWMPELMASMAIMGVDGTLTRRMRKEPIEGRAHMKTGTVRDASCIAGYLLDPDGQRWVVVVLVNALPGRRLAAWHGHAVHHALLRWVFEGAELR